MSGPPPPPGRRRWWKYLLILSGTGLLLLLAGLWYITTNAFQNLVRRRIVAEVERLTGGHATIGSFHTIPFRMQVDIRDITVHGSESATEMPLAHADRLMARVKIISLLRTDFGFNELSLENPAIHLAFYPNGKSNFPGARIAQASGKNPVEEIFALSIDRLYVRRGQLLWNDQTIPLDIAVNDVSLQMEYSLLRRRYESRLLLGKVDTIFDGYRPFSWMTTALFSLGPNFADIQSLKFNSGRSHIEASGRVSDFRNPQVQATYDGLVDLAEIASIGRRNDLREGMLETKGSGSWSAEEFSTSGVLAVRDLSWQNEHADLRKVAASSEYRITDQQFKLTKLQGKVLGGIFSGEAQIENWLHSVPPATKDIAVIAPIRPSRTARSKGEKNKLPQVQTGSIRLRARDVSAAEMVDALGSHGRPLKRIHPVGLASGTIDVNWKRSVHDAQAGFDFEMSAPARVAPGELPVTAKISGSYRNDSGELNLPEFNLSTPASRVQASGTLAASASLRLSIFTSNIEEWRPVVAALGGPEKLPLDVNGSASLNGSLGGTLSAPTLAGTLTATNIGFTLPPTKRAPAQEAHWDSLQTTVQLSSRSLILSKGNLRRGGTNAEFEVTAPLEHGQIATDEPLHASVNLHNVDVAATTELAGYDYPVTGNADLVLQLAGTRNHPEAQGHIHAVNASAYGESITRFDTDLIVAGGETGFQNIHLAHDDASVTGNAAYNPSSRVFRLDLAGNNFELSRIRQIQVNRLDFTGRADFTLQGSGTVESPELTAQMHLRDLTLDQELSGGFDLQAVTRSGELYLTGQSQFAHGSLALDGTVQMRGDYPANVSFRMEQLDLDALWRSYLRGTLTGHSAVAGVVKMEGPLRYPGRWVLDGDLSNLLLDVQYAKVHNQDPVRFRYADKKLRLEQIHLVGDGTDVTGRGSVNFGGAQDLDLAGDGHIDLKLASGFDPNVAASGVMTLKMTVGGTLSEPIPEGTLDLAGGAMAYAGLPSGLSEMNGSLNFTRDLIHINNLSARTGGGTLDLKGDAINRNHQLNFNFTAIGKDVRLRYPPGVSSTANEELHWVGTRSASTLSGDIMVTKLGVAQNFDFSSYLRRSRQISSLTPSSSPLYNVKLDVAVHTAPELQMKTAVARLSGDADLRVRGSVASPAILGRADILEGEATFNGTKFRLERGDITFANPVAIEPQLNLEASTHVRNYDLSITVTGTPDRLAINYRSEPPLPKSDIIALLALGRTSEESEQLQQQSGQTVFTDEATALIIDQAINSTVSSRMQKLFGASRIKIDPQGLTTETNPTARGPQVTIEQQFANNVSLTYSTNVSQSSQQIIQGEYYFTRNISAVGTRDQNGVVSFDVRIRRRKK